MNNSIDKTTSFADTANSPTTSPSDTKVEDWMLEIWDWVDNHSIHSSEDSIVPRDPQSLRQLERLDLGFGRSITHELIDGKSVLSALKESTKPLPAAIGNLKNLKYLRLIGFSELPDEIAQLDNLEELVFLRCGYVEFPKVLCELKNLKSLNIYSKTLQKLPDEIGNLTSLKNLKITGTSIEHLPDSIAHLTNLETMKTYANRDLKTLPVSIGNLSKLQTLDVRGSELEAIPHSIGNLKQLKELILYSNSLESLPDSLTNLKQLERLDVSENPLSNLPDSVRQFIVDLGNKVFSVADK
ncbi:leucine-rich repeat domain-containing protein [Psychrobacter phenylpyruvicus]|uniref:E3 ubiquitin-protein ligase SlrP n=1 Tax=Psychrobacter phenylpyruvicus TaxID=29432 RepID=A0A379LNH7_9GAMM|nr:leucine-rich repeat domain-containing protein [Psychrobacter phenylpyruvicus]SUD91314.1 E3 ubiquitin-protein ligase SlrP [Psychrobacter phenylpyruvicus]